MKKEYKNQNRYVYGSTAPKLETAEHYNERQGTRETEKVRAARRNQERATSITKGYVAFLTFATVLVFAACAVYVGLQADVNDRMSNIASLESQIVSLKTDNDATLQNLQTSVNINQVRKTAMNKLGMIYPKENQIQYYNVDKSDYMEQVEDIPETGRDSIFQLLWGEN